MRLDGILGKQKQEVENKKIDVKELISNDVKRKNFITALNKVKVMIDGARNDGLQKTEWEGFFSGLGFKDINEVSHVIKTFVEILEKKDLIRALGQWKNIKKISDNFDEINAFLAQRGLNLAEAI